METKLIEIRDKGTFIPAIAVALTVAEAKPGFTAESYRGDAPTDTERYLKEQYLLRRAGYSADRIRHYASEPYILLTDLTGGRPCNYDAFDWTDRTWHFVHVYLDANWSKVRSGDVIDVEFILNETDTPKTSERLTCPV